MKVAIYVTSGAEMKGYYGQTLWQQGRATIFLAPSVAKSPRLLAKTLIHEFTHIIEYLNDPAYLSAEVNDGCTALAQTMEAGMTDLLLNLRLAPGSKWPFALRSRKLARKGKQ